MEELPGHAEEFRFWKETASALTSLLRYELSSFEESNRPDSINRPRQFSEQVNLAFSTTTIANVTTMRTEGVVVDGFLGSGGDPEAGLLDTYSAGLQTETIRGKVLNDAMRQEIAKIALRREVVTNGDKDQARRFRKVLCCKADGKEEKEQASRMTTLDRRLTTAAIRVYGILDRVTNRAEAVLGSRKGSTTRVIWAVGDFPRPWGLRTRRDRCAEKW